MSDFYAHELKEMHEDSLFVCRHDREEITYRLFWYRSLSSQPMARVVLKQDGTGILTVKLLNRECMPLPPGETDLPCHLAETAKDIVLTKTQTLKASELLQMVPWSDEEAQLSGRNSEDGADWVFEERNDDRYRYADFRAPSPAAKEFTRLVFWEWSHLLPESERRTVEPGFYYRSSQ